MVRADFFGSMVADRPFAFFFHWKGSPHFSKMLVGNLGQIRSELSNFLCAHHDSIVITKAFLVGMDERDIVFAEVDQFAHQNGWIVTSQSFRRFLEDGPCETLIAKKLMRVADGRIEWKPIVVDNSELMEDARIEGLIPVFVNNARSYVLWAINDYNIENVFPSPKKIIEHKANTGFYRKKTIYNELSELQAEQKIYKMGPRQIVITGSGKEELNALEEGFNLSRNKNPRTLRMY